MTIRRITIGLPFTIYRDAKREARRSGVPFATIVRRALIEHLANPVGAKRPERGEANDANDDAGEE